MIKLAEQIAEVQRELSAREGVYRRLVSAGKLKASVAEYRTECMKAVWKTLCLVHDNEEAVAAVAMRASLTNKGEA